MNGETGILPRHPGGEALTRKLLSMSALKPCRILDMGAGSGCALRLLASLGYDAKGIDIAPGKGIVRGDFLHCPFPDESFDAILSECAFFVSGDVQGAFQEAARLLYATGKLLFSDVYFGSAQELCALAEKTGFKVLSVSDETEAWREYFLSCVWAGTADTLCEHIPGKKCRYYLMFAERSQ